MTYRYALGVCERINLSGAIGVCEPLFPPPPTVGVSCPLSGTDGLRQQF